MQIFWIIIASIIILLALFILIKEIRKMLKGRCCERCKGCAMKGECPQAEKDKGKNKKQS